MFDIAVDLITGFNKARAWDKERTKKVVTLRRSSGPGGKMKRVFEER